MIRTGGFWLWVAYVTPWLARYSRINCRTTCEGVRSWDRHNFSKARFFTGSINTVMRAVFVSIELSL